MKKTIIFIVALLVALFIVLPSCSKSNEKNVTPDTVAVIDTTGTDTVGETAPESTTGEKEDSSDSTTPAEITQDSEAISDTTAKSSQADSQTTAKSSQADIQTTAVHVHNYTVSSYTAPTCTDDGVIVYTCSCGKSYSEIIPATGHNYTGATCTSPATCVICGTTEGEPLGHNFVGGVCTRCGEREHTLGITVSELISFYGQPSEKLSENTTVGIVFSYIYISSDYKQIKIFQVMDERVRGMFATGEGTTFLCGGEAITPTEDITNGVINFYVYRDTVGSGNICGVWARETLFSYGLDTVNDYAVQSRICLHLTNYYRAINGVPTLLYSDAAALAATGHSIDMAQNDYFEHMAPDGGRVGDRLTAAGVLWSYCGENILAGYQTIGGVRTSNVFYATHSWYLSPGHRVNMLDGRFTYLGVGFGCNYSSTYVFYVTQNFY